MRQRHIGNANFGPGSPMTGMPIFGSGRGGRGRGRGGHHGDMRLSHMPHPAHHPMHPPEWAQGAPWPGGWNPAPWNGPGHQAQWAAPQQPNSIWQPAGRHQNDAQANWDQPRMTWHWQQQQQAPQQHMGHPGGQSGQGPMWNWDHHGNHGPGNQWSAQAVGGEQPASGSMAL